MATPDDQTGRSSQTRELLGRALWRHRDRLRLARDRFHRMAEAVGSPVDLDLGQWFQLYAFALEVEPDLVLELGRGYGNSTCVFTEAAQTSGGRVLSISNDTPSGWATRTEPQ